MSAPAANSLAVLAQADGSNAALLTFAAYTLVVFLLAWLSHQVLRRQSGFLAEYFLSSRGLGMLALALTFGATSASAGSFAGFPAKIYAHGWVLALWIGSYMIFPLCGMGILGKRLNQMARRTGSITVPDVFRERFQSPALAIVGTAFLALFLTVYLVPQFKVASLIIQRLLENVPAFDHATRVVEAFARQWLAFTEMDSAYLLSLGLFAVLVVVYTTVGGFRAVVWTDVLQGFVMLTGVIFLLVMTLWQVGGLSTATEKIAKMKPPRVGTVVFVSATPMADGEEIPTDRWFTLGRRDDGRLRLFRTNQRAVIQPGETRSNAVKVVELTTASEIDRVIKRFKRGRPPSLPGSLQPEVQELQSYASGAGEQGVYVRAPGPDQEEDMGFLPIGLAISFFVYWALSGTGQPNNMLRLMAFDRSRTIKRAIVALSIYFGFIYIPLVIIFSCARLLVPGLDQSPDRVMPAMAFTVSGNAGVPWMAGLLVAAPFAAAMSTVDSFMLMISSSLVRDIYQRNINPQAPQRRLKWLSYLCTLLIGVLATIGAVNPPKFLQYLVVFSGGGMAAAFLVPMALGLYWPRFNAPAAMISMVGGFLAYVAPYLVGLAVYEEYRAVKPLQLHPIVWGLAISAVLAVVVARFTAPPPQRLVRTLFARPRAENARPPEDKG